MKHIFTFLTLVSSLVAFCQAPNAMSYQAVIRDASNELVIDQSMAEKSSFVLPSPIAMLTNPLALVVGLCVSV